MNFLKKESKINLIGLFVVALIAIIVNQFYGNLGLFPHDSLSHFDTGFRITNGFYPFKDFWIVSGPFIDYSQALIFKVFGVNWNSYVFHASLINAIISCSTFYIFRHFQINIYKSIFFGICFAFLAYPSSGTPFVDHHSAFLSVLGLYCVILTIKLDSKLFSFFIPIFFLLAFLSKQVPATYIALLSTIFYLIYIFFNNRVNLGSYFLLGFILIFLMIFFVGFLHQIEFKNFVKQYILYPQTIASKRFNQFDFSVPGIIGNFKFILVSLILLLYFYFKKINFKNLLKDKNFYFISIFFILTLSLLLHQVLTKNQIFIFFLIPLLLGLTEVNVKNKYFSYFLIILCLFCTLKYHERFNEKRKFHELVNVDLSKALNANLIDEKLNNLKWITPQFGNNPKAEINEINSLKKILENDNSKKMVLSNYSFLSVILNDELFSTTRWFTFDGTDYPLIGNRYFSDYKKMFLKKISNNKIEVIYVVKPVSKQQVLDLLKLSCFDEKKINSFVSRFNLKTCEDID